MEPTRDFGRRGQGGNGEARERPGRVARGALTAGLLTLVVACAGCPGDPGQPNSPDPTGSAGSSTETSPAKDPVDQASASQPGSPKDVDPETLTKRQRARALLEKGRGRAQGSNLSWEQEAHQIYLALVPDPANAGDLPGIDRLGAALAALVAKDGDRAGTLLKGLVKDQKATADVRDRALYALGTLRRLERNYTEALDHFETLGDRRPDWQPQAFYWAALMAERTRQPERAQQYFTVVVTTGPEVAGIYYDPSLFRLARFFRKSDPDRFTAMIEEFQERKENGLAADAGSSQLESGSLLSLPDQPPPTSSATALQLVEDTTGLTDVTDELLGPASKVTPDAQGGGAQSTLLASADFDHDGHVDLVHAALGGELRVLWGGDGAMSVTALTTAPAADALVLGDMDNDGGTDIVVHDRHAGTVILRKGAKRSFDVNQFQRPDRTLVEPTGLGPAGGEAVAELHVFDFDHDGDLDLLAVREGDAGLAMFRNSADGAFVDVTNDANLGGVGAVATARLFDPDDDVDLDVAFSAADGTRRWLRNDRFGRFADAQPLTDAPAPPNSLAFPFGLGAPWLPSPEAGRVDLVDDLDADGFPERHRFDGQAAVATDLDGDRHLDVVIANGLELRVLRNDGLVSEGRRVLRVDLRGARSNRSAIASVIEVLAGAHYARRSVSDADVGKPILIAAGAGEEPLEVVRIRWPNGVFRTVQPVLDVDPDASRVEALASQPKALEATLIAEEPKPIGSCPFLYAWDGTRMRFLTDIDGAGGIGLGTPTPQGLFAFPYDPNEQVLISGDVLTERDGRYELVVTEELLETTYVDQARLFALDHPAGTIAVPDERFSFSPPPSGDRIYCVADARPPVAAHIRRLKPTAEGGWVFNGKSTDVLEAVAREDRTYAMGFDELGGQFLGVAEPHALILEVGEIPAANVEHRVLLLCQGFLRWAEPATSTASMQARDPALRPWPLAVEVDMGNGRWRRIIEDAGYPSGRQKTVVIDLTGKLSSGDERIRLVSNRAIYWDHIAVSTQAADTRFKLHEAPLVQANCDAHGINEYTYPEPDGSSYEDHIYEQPMENPPWGHAPGLHTAYGEVTELCQAADDRLVIISGGDEVRLSFEAGELPAPPEGWRRDWILRFVGYCKGADLNAMPGPATWPYPFLEMSRYPFERPDERPTDRVSRARWIEAWQTREGKGLRDLRAIAAKRSER